MTNIWDFLDQKESSYSQVQYNCDAHFIIITIIVVVAAFALSHWLW